MRAPAADFILNQTSREKSMRAPVPDVILKRRERRMGLRDTVQKYRNSGITDTKKITTGIRAGLDPEDAIYAIKLAENIGKEDWENPTIRADYQERYKEVLGDSADVIWDNIDKFF